MNVDKWQLIPFLLLEVNKVHGTPLTSGSNKRLAVWAACERHNIPIGATTKRNGLGGAGGPSYVVDVEHLTRPDDEFRPEVGGERA